jgi:DNA repair exonuclease SbcCD ATPase subunit
MRLKEVTLTNFRSYKGVHTFRPSNGTFFVLGENNDQGYSSNGGGKTSLLASIAWCLYGELATGASKDAVIFYGEDEVAVEVKFEGLIVRRAKRRSKSEVLEFFADEIGGWIREDLSPTQDKLDRYLGVSKELFYNAFWLDNASKTVQFLFKRPAERLQILQDLLGEGFFAQAKKAASTRRLEAEKEAEKAEYAIDVLASQDKNLVSRIFELERQYEREALRIREADKIRAERLASLEEDIATQQFQLELEEAEHAQQQDQLVTQPEELIRNCALLEAQIKQAEDKYHKAYTGKTDSKCPTCSRPLDTHDKAQLEVEKGRVFQEVARLRGMLEQERKKKTKAESARRAIDKAHAAILERRTSIRVSQKQLETERAYESSMDRSSLQRISSLLEKDKASRAQLKKETDEKTAMLESLRSMIPKLKFWEEGFGSKGIQNLLLDDIRGLLDQFTKNYLSYFSGETLTVVYPKSDKGFEIVMSYRHKDTPVSNLSRGEVGRSNMAVLLALRKTLLFMHKSKIDFIVLDDAVSDLDETGTQSIVDLSQALSKEIGHVFVTLPYHLPSIRPDQVIRVSKKDGVSQVA